MYLLVKVTEEVDLQIILKYVNKYHHQKEKKIFRHILDLVLCNYETGVLVHAVERVGPSY